MTCGRSSLWSQTPRTHMPIPTQPLGAALDFAAIAGPILRGASSPSSLTTAWGTLDRPRLHMGGWGYLSPTQPMT